MLNRFNLTISLPILFGLVLLLVTKIDLHQYSVQSVDVRTMLARELPIVLIGLVISVTVLLSSFYWLIKKQWRRVFLSILSPSLFVLCFMLSGAMGGAFLNAT